MPRPLTLIETALAVRRGDLKAKDLPERTRKRVEAILPSLGDAGTPTGGKPLIPAPFGSRTMTRRARTA